MRHFVSAVIHHFSEWFPSLASICRVGGDAAGFLLSQGRRASLRLWSISPTTISVCGTFFATDEPWLSSEFDHDYVGRFAEEVYALLHTSHLLLTSEERTT